MRKYIQFIGHFLFVTMFGLLLFAFAMFEGGFVSWFLFFSFLPILLYQMGLLCYPVKRWQITRSFPSSRIYAGDHVSVTIRMQRKFPYPLYYFMVEERIPHTLKKVDHHAHKYNDLHDPSKLLKNRHFKKVIFPWFKKNFDVHYELKHVPRGEHLLQHIHIKTTDIFGFIKKEHTFEVVDELNVYPANRSIRLVSDLPSLEQGAASSASFHIKQTNVVSNVREYVAGDKFSWIDWKQTARNQMMMTKEFEQEKSTEVLYVLDRCHYEQMNLLAFEAVVEVSLAFMKDMKKQASHVELLSIGADRQRFPVDIEAIQEHFMRVQPSQAHSFSKQLLTAHTDLGRYASIVIVTTNVDESLKEAIHKLNKQTKRVSIILIEPSSSLTSIKKKRLQQLEYEGVRICRLTEKELVHQPIEVNI